MIFLTFIKRAATCLWRYGEFIPLKTRNDGIHELHEMPEKHFA